MDRELEGNLNRLAGVISAQVGEPSLGVASIPDLEKLEGRIDRLAQEVEKNTEDLGLSRQYHEQVRSHLTEMTNELKSIRAIRKWASFLAVCIILFFTTAVFYFLGFANGFREFKDISEPNLRIAFLVGSLAMIFGLTALLVKGAFSSGKGLDGNGIVPEHVKLFTEAVKGNGGHG